MLQAHPFRVHGMSGCCNKIKHLYLLYQTPVLYYMAKKMLLFFGLFLRTVFMLNGKVYYVSPKGEDDNPGTLKYPKSNIQEAIRLLHAGDTLFLRGGIYALTESIQITVNGTPDRWINVLAYPGEIPFLDAAGVDNIVYDVKKKRLPMKGVVHILSSSFLRLSGLHVVNSHHISFLIQEPNTHAIELTGCHAENSYGAGIAVWYADSVTIHQCVITGAGDIQLRPQGAPAEKKAPYDALVVGGAKYFTITNCHLSKCFRQGIVCCETCSYGTIRNNHLEHLQGSAMVLNAEYGVMSSIDLSNNRVHHCDFGLVLEAGGDNAALQEISFHHNVIYENRGSGIVFSPAGYNGLRSKIYVYNNTVVKNGAAGHPAGSTGGIDLRSPRLSDVYVANNIVWQNYAFEIATFNNILKGIDALLRFNIVITHNLVGTPVLEGETPKGEWSRVYPYAGENSLSADPLFMSLPNGDFRLQPESPALHAGTTDLPFPADPHIGAYNSEN